MALGATLVVTEFGKSASKAEALGYAVKRFGVNVLGAVPSLLEAIGGPQDLSHDHATTTSEVDETLFVIGRKHRSPNNFDSQRRYRASLIESTKTNKEMSLSSCF